MKKNIALPHLLIGIAMFFAAWLSMAIKPTIILADQLEKFELEQVIPKQFHGWKLEEMTSHLVNPEEQASINQIYSQTLSRSYINEEGERVMLSIAYGKDQRDSVGVHLPEGCYGGQGFSVHDTNKTKLQTQFGQIPVSTLIASRPGRVEPITYWLTVGEKAVYGGWDMKKLKLNYAFKGMIPDGLLVRVSSINENVADAFSLQQRFTNDLLSSLTPSQRLRLMGASSESI